MSLKINTKTIVFVLAFLVATLLIIKLLPRERALLQVSQTAPENQSEEVPSDLEAISVLFNQPASLDRISIGLFPEIDYQPVLEENLLTLKIREELKQETKYIIEIYQEPEKTLVYSFSFTTKKVKKTLSDPKLLEEMGLTILRDYPLVPHVPYYSQQFDIDYIAPLKLKIVLKGETSKEEVLDWIRDQGVDPATHEIKWLTPESP